MLLSSGQELGEGWICEEKTGGGKAMGADLLMVFDTRTSFNERKGFREVAVKHVRR